MLLCLSGVQGCAQGPVAQDTDLRLVPLDRVLLVRPGEPLIVPVRPPETGEMPRRVSVRLGEREPTLASVYAVRAETAPGSAHVRWTPPPRRWSASPLRDPPAGGLPVLRIDVPEDFDPGAAGSARLRIAGSPYTLVREDPDPYTPSARQIEVWRGLLASDWMRDALDAARSSPLRRWRARLIDPQPDPPGDPDAFPDPVIEALASQLESRWRSALARVARADSMLAEDLITRLTLVVWFGDGLVVPVWSQDASDLAPLLDDMLDTGLADTEVVRRVRGWLERQPPALSWVIDDAGTTDAVTNTPASTLGLVNLTPRQRTATASLVSPGVPTAPPEIAPLVPFQTRSLVFPMKRPEDLSAPPRTQDVRVRVGAWAGTRRFVVTPVPVQPPGLMIGQSYTDWSLQRWLDAASSPDPMRATTDAISTSVRARVFRTTPPGRPPQWRVYVQARTPVGARADGDRVASVTIFLGPFHAPTAVIRLEPGTEPRIVRGTILQQSTDKPADGSLVATEQGWSASVLIPEESIEPTGLVRLAIVHQTRAGTRSSWPRPLLPWQTEPARVALDLTEWDGFPEQTR